MINSEIKKLQIENEKLQLENKKLNQMLQDKNTYLIEKHLTKDYFLWKFEHDEKNATS